VKTAVLGFDRQVLEGKAQVMNSIGRAIGRLAPFVLAVILFFVINLVIPGYANINSLLSLLLLSSLLGIAAVGQTLTIIVGGFDMSIPAVIGLANVLLSLLYGAGVPVWAAATLILALSIAIGLFNGFASRYLQLNPLVVTLATGSIVLGAIWAGTHGEVAGSVPDWLVESVSVIGATGPIPLPGAVVLWLIAAAAIVFLERRTVLGRWIFAAGANPRAAELAGVPMLFVWMAVYALSAALAAVAGMLLAGFSGAADPTVGATYLFTTVAAVVVGGTPLTGGQGGYGRTVAGCLIVTELGTLLVGLGLDQPAQQICLGILIVVLVAFYGREPHLSIRV
jgi:ribose transport system permease protein